jgi:predicted permease
VDIGRTTDGRGFDTVSYATYRDLHDRESLFEGVYALRLEPVAMSLGGDAGAERIYGEQVSGSYFDVLGLTASAGTFFRTDEERVGTPLRKIVLTHAFWQSRFAGRQDVVGRDLVLNGEHYTVVGVGPAGFHGTTVLVPDVWVPLTASARGLPADDLLRERENAWLIIGGRLRSGVSLSQAQAYLDAFAADLVRAYPDVYRGRGLAAAAASRIPGVGREFVAPFLGMLMGVVFLVLLVTCLNLSGLLLARTAGRSREIAVRLALGATRRSLAGLQLTETGLLFAGGTIAAVFVAFWASRVLAGALIGLPFPIAVDMAIDWRVLLFTGGVALVAAVLTSLVPAWRGAQVALVPDLKSDASAPRRQRARRVFIVAQLALCLVLVVAAGLFLRALQTASHISPGFDVDAIDVAAVDVALGGYRVEQAPAVTEQIRERLAAIPGVERVGAARMVPLEGGGLGLGGLRRKGRTGPDAEIDTDWNVISPDYLSAVGIPVVRGRHFTAADREGAPAVAIVNERLAGQVWSGEDPIGQVLENGDFRPGRESTIQTLTVVGVARGAKYRWLGESPAPFIYVPLAQQPMREVNFFLRRAGGLPASTPLAPAVRAALRDFDPNLPLVRLQSMRRAADLGMLPQRLAASVAGSLGTLALLLAGIGLYGVIAFAVASRTREIGLRMALGADRARVVRLVVWQGARLALVGGAIGLTIAAGVSRLLSSLLFGVSPLDPATYLVTLGLLALVTLAATCVPARRAARVDPATSLRSE